MPRQFVIKRFFRNIVLTFLIAFIAVLSPPASAASSGKVMLVLDASGSMWGRVENKEKILIAREVIGEMIDQWDPSLELGLVAYGHRYKGECSDIETLVPVGNDIEQIRQTVNGLQPKGKTPLSAAVKQAAEDLRFTEEKATVILVSDGKETCDLDPCEVGRSLEQLGVDFTAHVIGFDIAEADRAGLACLASETGGQYFDAQKTDELKAALSEAVQKIKQQPDTVIARLGENGSEIQSASLQWLAEDSNGSKTTAAGGALPLPLEPGSYRVTATLDSMSTTITADVALDNTRQHVAVFDAGDLKLMAKVMLSGTLVNNPDVQWSILEATDNTEVATARGEMAERITESGDYQVVATYQGQSQSARATVTAGEQTTVELAFDIQLAELSAPDQATIASEIEINWKGPGGDRDYITVVTPDAPQGQYGHYQYVPKGNPLPLTMPDIEGTYELRYVSEDDAQILARRPITVEPVPVELTASEVVPVSATFEVTWQGPNGKRDYITVIEPEADDGKYGNYFYTEKHNPGELTAPDQPGIYELRYKSGDSGRIMARKPITVEAVAIGLNAPASTSISSTINIEWQGPDGKGDYITVVPSEFAEGKYGNYSYTKKGNPLSLLMPDTAGIYELRYVSGQSKSVLAKQAIEVTPVAVTINAPDTVAMSSSIEIGWQGPDAKSDYLTVIEIEAEDGKYGNYAYTQKGNPLKLVMPDSAGQYELRYVSAQSKQVLARKLITIEEVTSTLAAPDNASIGEVVEIAWQGPDGRSDYISVSTPESDGKKYINYSYTRKSNPLKLQMPDEAGLYELRYVSSQSRVILARRPIQIEAVTTTLYSLGIAKTGDKHKIYWQGPAGKNDYISVAQIADDSKKSLNRKTVSESPLELNMPADPGRYEIRYVTGQNHNVLARKLIEVVDEANFAAALAAGAPGKLTLSVKRGESLVTDGLSWQVYGVDGVNSAILNSDQASPVFELPMGIYRVNLGGSAGSATRDVIIDAGGTVNTEIRLP